MKYETKEQAIDGIKRAIRQRGQFTHNIVSIILRQVDEKFGRDAANAIVDELKLAKKFGITKVESE